MAEDPQAWVANVRKCILEKCTAAIEVDVLYRLKLEVIKVLLYMLSF